MINVMCCVLLLLYHKRRNESHFVGISQAIFLLQKLKRAPAVDFIHPSPYLVNEICRIKLHPWVLVSGCTPVVFVRGTHFFVALRENVAS